MTGAEVLLQTLAASGIDVCFMNPGTSEMRFVAALDRVPQMRNLPTTLAAPPSVASRRHRWS